jgi:hypothetical protein
MAAGIEEAAVNEYDAAQVDRIARVALFDAWHWQLEGGHLNRAGLLALRGRLDETSGEFFPGPDLDELRLEAADALAADMGIDPHDLPDYPQVPDSPDDLPPPPSSRW